MKVSGGRARRLTSFPMGVADPVISPDGKHVAVTSAVYPECGADAGCNADMMKRREQGPLEVHVADDLLYRHWTSWRDGTYDHILLVDAERGDIEDRVVERRPHDAEGFSDLNGTGEQSDDVIGPCIRRCAGS